MQIIIKEKLKQLCYAKHLKLSAVLNVARISRSMLNMAGAVRLHKDEFVPVIKLSNKQIKDIESLLDCHRGEFMLNVNLLNDVVNKIK